MDWASMQAYHAAADTWQLRQEHNLLVMVAVVSIANRPAHMLGKARHSSVVQVQLLCAAAFNAGVQGGEDTAGKEFGQEVSVEQCCAAGN